MAAIAALYALNRFLLVPLTAGPLHRLLAWYGADFLSGGLMLCLLNSLLAALRRPPLRQPLPVTLFLLGCGLFWEYLTPLYLPRSVSDPRDILAVWLGGVLFCSVDSTIRKILSKNHR
jgi:hypothetical protein